MQRIVPNIWSNGEAEAMGAFYASVLRSTTAEVSSRYPTAGLLPFQEPLAGQPLTVDLDIDGYRMVIINAGPEFKPNASVSFLLNFDPLMFGGDTDAAIAELDRVHAELLHGGRASLPLGEYPFSPHYAWVEDRYGVNWQLMLTNPAGDPRPFVVPWLQFPGTATGTSTGTATDAAYRDALDAIAMYTGLLPDSAPGFAVPHPDDATKTMFSEFRLYDQWFAASDGSAQADAFSCGVSLEIRCETQAEIDTYWNALSAVPEAEQCGWLADRFGLSWQITPANMGELMQRPHAFEHMLQMGRIIIDEL